MASIDQKNKEMRATIKKYKYFIDNFYQIMEKDKNEDSHKNCSPDETEHKVDSPTRSFSPFKVSEIGSPRKFDKESAMNISP